MTKLTKAFKHRMKTIRILRAKLSEYGLRPDWAVNTDYFAIADLKMPRHCHAYTDVKIAFTEIPQSYDYKLFDVFPEIKAWVESGRAKRINAFHKRRTEDENFFNDRDGLT